MTGLVYKELKQNGLLLLGVIMIPALIAFPLCAWIIKDAVIDSAAEYSKTALMDTIKNEQYVGVWLTFLCIAFIFAGIFQSMVFRGDDRKVWASFIASTSAGVKGYIRIKYELTLVMMLITLFSVQLGELIMTLICAAHNVEWLGLSAAMIWLSYIQIILRAADIPFTIRFGMKNGSIIKSSMLVVIALVLLIVYAVFGEKMIDSLVLKDIKSMSGLVQILLSVVPVIALALYYLSYRLSCRIYMKGVQQYDK